MPPKKAAQGAGIAIVLDIGPHMEQLNQRGETAFSMAQRNLTAFLERKIFCESNDSIALVTLGSPESKNALNEAASNFYKHISIIRELGAVNWDAVKQVESIAMSNDTGDFIEALYVAADMLVTANKKTPYEELRVYLFSNLSGQPSAVCKEDLESAVNDFKSNDIYLSFVGVDFDEETQNQQSGCKLEPSDEQPGSSSQNSQQSKRRGDRGGIENYSKQQAREHNIQLANDICKAVVGQSFSFEAALKTLSQYKARDKRGVAWKTNLEIGGSESISLPIVQFIKTKKAEQRSWEKTHIQDTNVSLVAKKSWQLVGGAESNGDDEEGPAKKSRVESNGEASTSKAGTSKTINVDDTLTAYRYGKDLIPVTEAEIDSAKLKTERCLKLLAFCPAEHVQRHFWIGESISVTKIDPSASKAQQAAFSALIHALIQLKRVALVRKVYNRGNNPYVGCLIPEVGTDDDGKHYEVLYYVQLPFAEEVSRYMFKPLPVPDYCSEATLRAEAHFKPKPEQQQVVDDFVDAAMLPDDDEDDTFTPEEQHDPTIQRRFECIKHRILRGNAPLPDPSDNLHAPAEVLEERRQALEKLAKTCRLVPLDYSQKRRIQQVPVAIDSAANSALNGVGMSVGPMNPVEDYLQILRSNSRPFDDASSLLLGQLHYLVKWSSYATDHLDKAVAAIRALREQSIAHNRADVFNEALADLFEAHLTQVDFFDHIINVGLGMIMSTQSPKSPASAFSAPAVRDFVANVASAKSKMSGKTSAAHASHSGGNKSNGETDLLDNL